VIARRDDRGPHGAEAPALRPGGGVEGIPRGGPAKQILAHADRAVDPARRAARGEIGALPIGFLGSATAFFVVDRVGPGSGEGQVSGRD
jgi:hypothetical protein